MRSGKARAVCLVRAHIGKRGFYVRNVRGHGRGAERGNARGQMVFRHGIYGLVRGFHAVLAPAAVGVDVDVSRAGYHSASVYDVAHNHVADGNYSAVLHDYAAFGFDFALGKGAYVYYRLFHFLFSRTSMY